MKVQKLLTLDHELIEKLKQEDNASALVNSLLIKHYNDCRSEKQILQDVKDKIKEKQEEIDREKRIREGVKKRYKEMREVRLKREKNENKH